MGFTQGLAHSDEINAQEPVCANFHGFRFNPNLHGVAPLGIWTV